MKRHDSTPAISKTTASGMPALFAATMQQRHHSGYHYLAFHMIDQLDIAFDELLKPSGMDLQDVTLNFRQLYFGDTHTKVVNTFHSHGLWWAMLELLSRRRDTSHCCASILRHLLISQALYWNTIGSSASNDAISVRRARLYETILLVKCVERGFPVKPTPFSIAVPQLQPKAISVLLSLVWRLLNEFQPLARSAPLPDDHPARCEEVLADVARHVRALLLRRGTFHTSEDTTRLLVHLFASANGSVLQH